MTITVLGSKRWWLLPLAALTLATSGGCASQTHLRQTSGWMLVDAPLKGPSNSKYAAYIRGLFEKCAKNKGVGVYPCGDWLVTTNEQARTALKAASAAGCYGGPLANGYLVVMLACSTSSMNLDTGNYVLSANLTCKLDLVGVAPSTRHTEVNMNLRESPTYTDCARQLSEAAVHLQAHVNLKPYDIEAR